MNKKNKKLTFRLLCTALVLCFVFFFSFIPANSKNLGKNDVHIHNPIHYNQASIEKGQKVFDYNCLSCHGKHGTMHGYIKFLKQHRHSKKKEKKHIDSDVYHTIAQGKGRMPSFNKRLTVTQIWNTVNFLKSMKYQMYKE